MFVFFSALHGMPARTSDVKGDAQTFQRVNILCAVLYFVLFFLTLLMRRLLLEEAITA